LKQPKKTSRDRVRAGRGKIGILPPNEWLHSSQHGNQNGTKRKKKRANPESLIFSNWQSHFLPIKLKITGGNK
jgi:hypothetical protein